MLGCMKLREWLVLIVGVMLIAAAYWWSDSTWRDSMRERARLDQQYRCILANGRDLRGARFEDCRQF